MKLLDGYKINPANDKLIVAVIDEPGHGGASHVYRISGFEPGLFQDDEVVVKFQNGPINTYGINGVTHEVLLAILIDRLEDFQKGTFANAYNAVALDHLKDARASLLARTRERMVRGVEGTHEK